MSTYDEPWWAKDDPSDISDAIHTAHGQAVLGDGYAPEDIDRIVACVNACREIPTDFLERDCIRQLLLDEARRRSLSRIMDGAGGEAGESLPDELLRDIAAAREAGANGGETK
jgi:hypothetical protein